MTGVWLVPSLHSECNSAHSGDLQSRVHILSRGITYVATEGYPSAIAGLMCSWKGHSPLTLHTYVSMTYLLFEDRETLMHVYPAHPASCLTHEGRRRICYDPHYYGPPARFLFNPYHRHIVWTDGTLFLTDATVVGAIHR